MEEGLAPVVSEEPEPIPTLDWHEIRRLSLQPGGFGNRRVELWPRLLGVEPPSPTSHSVGRDNAASDDAHVLAVPSTTDTDDSKALSLPHPDERQIQLDTDRSFVLYPVASMSQRVEKQGELYDLIVRVFRKRRRLSYFQGYHDIVSVLFLTLPQELQIPCVEKLSLHRVRDSMGASLEPVVGLLRVLQRVLKLADPAYAELLEQNAPLPYFALSNLLTLFSHDIPTLPLIQHVFDYLLCRPPIFAVYLAAAFILARKEDVERLQQEGEEGMIHSLLSALPDLSDGDDPPQHEVSEDAEVDIGGDQPDTERADQSTTADGDDDVSLNGVEEALSSADSTLVHSEGRSISDGSSNESTVGGDDTLVDASEGDDQDMKASFQTAMENSVPPESAQVGFGGEDPEKSRESVGSSFHEGGAASEPGSDVALPSSPPSCSNHKRKNESGSSSSDELPHKPRVSLSSLLERADELHSLYPPSHPAVDVPSIMGPQSVMLTWSENASELPVDDEAELMVTQPHLIALPPPEEADDEKLKGTIDGEEETRKAAKRRRRKLRKSVRIGSVVVEQRTVVASAVLVISVAMAVYGLQAAPERHHTASRELKKLSKYVGGLVVGLGGRMVDRLFAER